jgi:hypothetical protein
MATSMVADLMDSTIEAVGCILGTPFTNDPGLLWEACQAAGSPYRAAVGRNMPTEANKRLAQIGNSCADLWVWQAWYSTTDSRGKIMNFLC